MLRKLFRGISCSVFGRRVALPVMAAWLLLFGVWSSGQAQFMTSQTRNMFLVYYDPADAYVLPHLARCFENSLAFHRKLFDFAPSEKVVILLEDFDDYGYAGATSIPYNFLRLGIEPYKYVFDTSPTNERFNWVMNHELTHIVASDKPAPADQFYRSLFSGKVVPIAEQPLSMVYSYMTNPRKYSPRWYHEGIAVFLETWMSGGLGRALGGYDEMVFRAMVRDSSYIYDVVGLESEGTTIDFQVGANSYLYGTRFVSYLANTFGPEKVLQWFSRTDSSRAYYATQFEKIFSVDLDDEWSHWIQWERLWQAKNLDSIRQYPTSNGRRVSRRALGSVSQAYYDSSAREIYAAVNYPGQVAHIAAISLNDGSVRKICDVTHPALYYVSSLALDRGTGTLFFTTNNSRSWRHLYKVNVRTGDPVRLLSDARTGDLAFNAADRSLWGIRHHSGLSRIVRIPAPYNEIQELVVLEYGKDLFDIDISPDGRSLIGSYSDVSGRQTLVRMEVDRLLRGNAMFDVLMELSNTTSPETFVFSPDGSYLLGTSYYTGVSNVFRYDVAAKTHTVLTNAETGYFRPMPFSADSLIAFEYSGEGFIPVMLPNRSLEDVSAIQYLGQEIVEKHPVVKEWVVGSPLTVNLDSVGYINGDYGGFNDLRLQSAYPIAEGYKNFVGLGARANFVDPLQLHNLDLTVSYAPNTHLPMDERFHAALQYGHAAWTVRAAYNLADFYDLFGPTKVSRKGYSLGLTYGDYILYDRPTTLAYTLGVSGYAGLERLPLYQNVATTYDNFLTARANLKYTSVKRSLGAVDEEKGIHWSINGYTYYVRTELFPLFQAGVDWGIPLPLDHSSVWLRVAAGQAFGDRETSFGNFYFGGFGNNWVDHQEVKRYREYDAFPGVELNSIGGRNFVRGMAEWALPPVRFRRFGFTDLYCTWARFAAFTTAIVTDLDADTLRRKVANIGLQVDFRLVIFSRLESTLSFGYATAVEQSARRTDEFMVSLKIL